MRVLSEMTDLSLDLDPLDGAIARFHQQLEEALRENDDLRRYVARLEQVAPPSQAAEQHESELPSADELIEGLENFLRQRQDPDN